MGLKHEQLLNDSFRKIRNKIKKCSVKQPILLIIQELHKINKESLTNKNVLNPYYLFPIIRLFLIYGGEKYPTEDINLNTLKIFHNIVLDMDGHTPLFNDTRNSFNDFKKYYRVKAFQQFWFQKPLRAWDISHQLNLFCNVKWENYELDKKFNELTGLKILEFIELSFAAIAYFYNDNHKHYLEVSVFKDIQKYPSHKILNFLNLLSLSENDAKGHSKKRFVKQNIGLHISEESPFLRYPFIIYDEKYYCYSPELLYQGGKNFIYDYMKENDREEFCTNFGPVFEKYIKMGLDNIEYSYKDEDQICKCIGKKRKAIDFIVDFGSSNLLIEAKAVEMNYYAKINPCNEILYENLSGNIIKAIKQIYSVISYCKTNKNSIINSTELFAFIITYRQHYLGPVEELWEEFLYDALKGFFKEEEIDPEILDPGRIFILDLEDFDGFIHFIYSNNDPNELLQNAYSYNFNANKLEKKLIFCQNYAENLYKSNSAPDYLTKPAEDMFDGLINKLKSH